jgi:hypothetical protein
MQDNLLIGADRTMAAHSGRYQILSGAKAVRGL